jgi:natural product biosynthesis luciferase-like monooxygenase protein
MSMPKPWGETKSFAGARARRGAQALVCCGRPSDDEVIRVVDPESMSACPEGRVGEIWLASPSVATGYWGNAEATDETFGGRTAPDEGRAFCRTGDLGFLHKGGLYVAGRLKDLIIIRGRNHHPNDIEATAIESHPAIEASGCAAFAVPCEDEERLVVLAELRRAARLAADVDAIAAAIKAAVLVRHEVSVHQVVLLQPGQLPKTSSGKVQRRASRVAFLEGSLRVVGPRRVQAAQTPPADLAAAPSGLPGIRPVARELIEWLRGYGAERINSRLMDERRSIPPNVVLDFGNRGLLGMVTSERHGGLGLTTNESVRVMQQLAAIDLNLAAFVGVHHALGTYPIEHHAKPALRERWLPELARGRQLSAFAVTEPDAGSNPNALSSRAEADGAGAWRLWGDKSWIGNGSWAGIVNVFVRAQDMQGVNLGFSGFAVPADRRGMVMGPEALTMGMRGMVQNSVQLRGVRVADADMLGETGRGMQVAQEAMMLGRLGIAAISLGGMKRCAQLMERYASRRSIATGRLLDNPVTRARLTDLTRAIAAVEALTDSVCSVQDGGRFAPPEAFAAVKILGPEPVGQAVDQLMQLLGGRGYIESNLVPQMLRDARLLRVFEGPTEALVMYLGAQALSGSEGLYAYLSETLRARDTAEALRRAVGEVKERAAAADERHAVAAALGEVAAEAFLCAAAQSDFPRAVGVAKREIAAWTSARLDECIERVVRRPAAFDPADRLVVSISAYESDIGHVEQTAAGEDHALDPLLRLDASDRAEQSAVPQGAPVRSSDEAPRTAPATPAQQRGNEVEDWIIAWISKRLNVPASTIDPSQSVLQLGLDSLVAIQFTMDLEAYLGRPVRVEQLWEQPTIGALAAALASPAAAVARADVPARSEAERVASAPEASIPEPRPLPPAPALAPNDPVLSLFFFSSSDDPAGGEKYRLVREACAFADANGFHAAWFPERHFHRFGGLYPNPVTLAAAAATWTRTLRLRAGSVVLPLHDPVRVAEEWSVVDNLSNGRVDLSFTSGWNADDFLFFPERFAQRQDHLRESVDIVRRLWRGEAISRPNGKGEAREIHIYPRPVQSELPVWITCNRGRQGFERAGALGAHVLTALLGQTMAELETNLDAYRAARSAHGHDPQAGQVTLMLHTYMGESDARVREAVRGPMRSYLKDSLELWSTAAKPLGELTEQEREVALDFAFERYYQTSALMGDAAKIAATIEAARRIGVTEIACLIDFGLESELIMDSLARLRDLRARRLADSPADPPAAAPQRSPRLPLAQQQAALWTIQQMQPQSVAYNQALAVEIGGPLDIDRAIDAMRDVVASEPALRDRFDADENGVFRWDAGATNAVVGLDETVGAGDLASWLRARVDVPFDLRSGPLVRVDFVRLRPDRHVLLFVNHHIIADGRSLAVLIRRWLARYRGQDDGGREVAVDYDTFVSEQQV